MRLVRLLRAIVFAGLLVIPSLGWAMQTMDWDFRHNNLPGSDWDAAGWSADAKGSEQGLHVSTQTDGKMVSKADFPFPVDAVELTFLAPHPTQAILLWHNRSMEQGLLVQLPFEIRGDAQPIVVRLDLSIYPAWDAKADRLGLALPAGADVTVQNIRFLHWNMLEKVAEAWRSFWTFDQYHSYTVNFLWGPLLTFSSIGREQLFTTLPPKGWSAGRIFLPILGIVALLLLLHWFFVAKRGSRASFERLRLPRHVSTHAALLLAVFAGLWLFFDLRMGVELLSYGGRAYAEYVSQPFGKRLLGDHLYFEDAMEQSLPYLKQRPRFLFLGPAQTPFLQRMRYFGYPSLPVEDGQKPTDVNTVFVFERPDVTIDGQGHLMQDGKALTSPGKVLLRFGENSFLFRIQ